MFTTMKPNKTVTKCECATDETVMPFYI